MDDDWSDNNRPGSDARLSGSDEIFRALVAAAVGDEASAWSAEIVETYKHGPAFERLRDFNVVLWYTGGSYGGGSDNVAVLSIEDEKTVRRYLQEAGGSFILVSPGYVNNLSYGSSWTESAHPFLKDVAGIAGFSGLVQRFDAGKVRAPDGSSFTVMQKGAAEPQFSAVNPDGAAIVFTSSLDPLKTAKEPVPVAVAHPFAGGRFVYVGFTFENVAEEERAKAFKLLLDAATGPRAAPGAAAPRVTPTVVQRKTPPQRIVGVVEPAPPVPPPVPTPTVPEAEEPNPKLTFTGLTYFKTAKIKIFTGNDNKEAPSTGIIELLVNGGGRDGDGVTDPNRPEQLARGFVPNQEFRVNSTYESVIEHTPGARKKQYEYIKANTWAEQDRITLERCQHYGLRLEITYEPNFVLDAWKIDRVELEIDFGFWEWWLYRGNRELGTQTQRYLVSKPAPGFPRVISFNRSALLNDANKKLVLLTDGFFFPK
ncbi:MAG: hypothetical protein Q8N18_00140 [Opitutaceae bacterium]|nr:hypothetical protein [Opitutaceae bacterium]